MTELTFPTAPEPPRVAAARAALATVLEHGGALPLPTRLAAAAAFNELEARADLPYPPARPLAVAAELTADAAAGLLALVTCPRNGATAAALSAANRPGGRSRTTRGPPGASAGSSPWRWACAWPWARVAGNAEIADTAAGWITSSPTGVPLR